MSYGLRVWNAAGQLVLDTTDRLTRHHSRYSLTLGALGTSQDVYVSGMSDDGTWAVSSTSAALVDIFPGYFRVMQTFNGASGTAYFDVFRL